MMVIVRESLGKACVERRNDGYQHFFFSNKMFKDHCLRVVKTLDCMRKGYLCYKVTVLLCKGKGTNTCDINVRWDRIGDVAQLIKSFSNRITNFLRTMKAVN